MTTATAPASTTLPPFSNERVRTFSDDHDRASMTAALDRARARLGAEYRLVIDGAAVDGAGRFDSLDPADPARVVGRVHCASPEQAAAAVEAADRRFDTWKRVPAERRAQYLLDAAALVRTRRDDFNALLVLEVGKPWVEADADTAEAIDFFEYYAREALRYDRPPPLVPLAGETSELRYLPLGVGVIIPPWNFAFAIMAGMTAAALATGNSVCLKPSEDSSVIAAAFVSLMTEVGLPPGVLNFVPGPGPTVGEALVRHPRTRFISFTGSKAVGLRIVEAAAVTQPGQRWIKRVVAEMGGKDAIVVAADADLDAAAAGIVASAFGFSGQKCSACSRAIVEDAVYDAVLERVVARTKALVVGDPSDPRTDVGPVVNERARRRILEYVERGTSDGAKLALGGGAMPGPGYFVEPTIFADVNPRSALGQEEIFGPFVAFMRARDFDEALAIANDTEFGLTGAVYANDPAKLDRAADEFFVGNLYLNRKCTGAFVGVHPFGGFNMSGTDSKAGGYDYLLQFLQAKMVARRPS